MLIKFISTCFTYSILTVKNVSTKIMNRVLGVMNSGDIWISSLFNVKPDEKSSN